MTTLSHGDKVRAAKSARAQALAEARDSREVTTRCEFCTWVFEGTFGGGRREAAEHREREHAAEVEARRGIFGGVRRRRRQEDQASRERREAEFEASRQAEREAESLRELARLPTVAPLPEPVPVPDPEPEPEPEPGPRGPGRPRKMTVERFREVERRGALGETVTAVCGDLFEAYGFGSRSGMRQAFYRWRDVGG